MLDKSLSRTITGLVAACLLPATVGSLLLFSQKSVKTQQNNSPQNSQFTIKTAFDAETLTVADTAIQFTNSIINPTCTDCFPGTSRASQATCVLETAPIRIFTHGDNPTASVGLLIASGTTFEIFGYDNIDRFSAIRDDASSGVLTCEFSR
jgi:hypothetical protein